MKVFRSVGIVLLVLVVTGLLIWGLSGISHYSEQQALKEQLRAQQEQAAFDSLPDRVQTLIVTIGALLGIDIIGQQLLLVFLAIVQLVPFAILLVLSLPFLAFARNPQYLFYAILAFGVIGALLVGLIVATLPGGRTVLYVELGAFFVLLLVALGGGFEIGQPSVDVDADFDPQRGGKAKVKVNGGSIKIIGRGRSVTTDATGKSEWK